MIRTMQMAIAGLLVLASTAVTAGDEALTKTLKGLDGKTVTLVLLSGAELSGKLSAVGEDTAKLSELRGKEFFDAVVNLEHVQAVLYRARGEN